MADDETEVELVKKGVRLAKRAGGYTLVNNTF